MRNAEHTRRVVQVGRESMARPDEWADDPEPLARAVPAWPGGSVGSVNDFVSELAEETQTPEDLAGIFTMSVLSATVAGTVDVNPLGSWYEPTNTYMVCALIPGSMKSAVMSRVVAPLLDYERAGVAEAIGVRQEAQARQAIAMARAKEAEKAAAKATDKQREAEDEAAKLAVDAAKIDVPAIPRLLADDATPEALTSLLADHHGRIAVLSSEGGVFDLMAGRYQATANLDVYLKGWSGDTIQIDRKGRAPEYVASPALTIGLAVQPWVLRDIAKQPGFRGRGIIPRFLAAIPDPRLGSRNVRDPRPVTAETLRAWRGLVSKMAATFSGDTKHTLTLTGEARDRFVEYREDLEPRLGEYGDLVHLTDFGGKLHGQVIRLAAITHLAERVSSSWGDPIGVAAMERAIVLADYFTAHALAVHDFMAARGGLDDAEAVLRWIRKNEQPTFTQRECHRGNLRRFPEVEALAQVLGMLADHGYIKALEREPTMTAGRPSIAFSAHPKTLTESTKPGTERTNNQYAADSVGSVNGFRALTNENGDRP